MAKSLRGSARKSGRSQKRSTRPARKALVTFQGSVAGRITFALGQPASGYTARALDRDLLQERLLGTSVTDVDGRYSIAYSMTSQDGVEKAHSDLVVQVLDAKDALLISSPLQPAATLHAIVDLRLKQSAPEPAEYDCLIGDISPRLRGASLADLTPEQVRYLAQVTTWKAETIQTLSDSARVALCFSGQSARVLSGAVFYAWLQQGLPRDAAVLALQSRDQLAKALITARDGNIVAEPDSTLLERYASVHARAVSASLARHDKDSSRVPEWPALAAALLWHSRVELELVPSRIPGHLSIADLFAEPAKSVVSGAAKSGLPLRKCRALAELLCQEGARTLPSAKMLESHGFAAVEQQKVLRTFALAELTKNHLPLIRALNALAINPATASAHPLAFLAPLTSKEWQKHVTAAGVPEGVSGETKEARQAAYAVALEACVERTNRTAVLAARIGQGRFGLAKNVTADLKAFFANDSSFSFETHFVHTYLGPQGAAKLDGVKDPVSLKQSLLQMERTIRLTDNYRQQSALLAKGFDSAQKISRVGMRNFLQQVASHPDMGTTAAQSIYARATHTAAMALNLAMRYRDDGFHPAALEPKVNARSAELEPATAAKAIPDLTTLFGPLDGSICDPNLSVLSPPAYFVDLLHFLDDHTVPDIQIQSPSQGEALLLPDNLASNQGLVSVPVVVLVNAGGTPNETLVISAPGVGQTLRMPVRATTEAVSYSNQVGVDPSCPTITAQLVRPGQNGDVVVVQDACSVAFLSGRLSNITPTYFTIDKGVTTATLAIRGSFQLPAAAIPAVSVISNDGATTTATLNSDGTFSAPGVLVNTTTPTPAAPTFTVVLMAATQAAQAVEVDRTAVSVSFLPSQPVTGTVSFQSAVSNRIYTSGSSIKVDYTISGSSTCKITFDTSLGTVVPASVTANQASGSLTIVLNYDLRAIESDPENDGIDCIQITATLTARGFKQCFYSGGYHFRYTKPLLRKAKQEHGRARGPAIAPSDGDISTSLLDILGQRRPDLARIELSVPNSTTILPYADLVLEILEGAVAAPFPRTIPIAPADLDDVATSLASGTFTPALQAGLAALTGIAVLDGNQVFVSVTTNSPPVLVCEIAFPGYRLSVTYVNGTLSLDWIVPQTSDSAGSIAGQPEHLNGGAYAALKQAGYPWTLPFDLWAEQARIYLAKVGVPRDQLMETFFPKLECLPENGAMTTAHLAAAPTRLGFTPGDLDIIAGRRPGTGTIGDPNTGTWNFWGFNSPALSATNSVPDPKDSTARIESGNWLDLLTGRVDVFLQQSGLSFDELRELLDMRFVNTANGLQPVLELQLGADLLNTDIPSSDLSQAKLVKLQESFSDTDVLNVMDRLHRFVRAWRKLGWPMRDLDQAICLQLGPSGTSSFALDESFISSVDRARELAQVHLRRSENVLSLHANNTYRDYGQSGAPVIPTLYERLFLNKSISDPVGPVFQLNGTRDELADATAPIGAHLAPIAAACGLSLQDAVLIQDWLGGAQASLSLDCLSSFFFAAQISRSTSISIADLLALQGLATGPGLPQIRAEAVLLPEAIYAAGFTPPEVLYLLAHQQSPSEAQSQIQSVTGVLETIRQDLASIALETTLPSPILDVEGAQVRRELDTLGWHRLVIEELFEVFEETFSVPLAQLPSGVNLPLDAVPYVSFAAGRLTTSKILSRLGRDELAAASEDAAYLSAVQALFDLPAQRISRDLGSYDIRDTAAPLATWPTGLVFPADLSARVYYDPVAKQVHVVGALDDTSFGQLTALTNGVEDGTGAVFLSAIQSLRDGYQNVPDGAERLLETGDKEILLGLDSAAERFAILLAKLVAHRCLVMSRKSVQDRLATTLGLNSAIVGRLLNQWLWSACGRSAGFAISDFLQLQGDLVLGTPALPVTFDRFPAAFKSLIRLSKVAALTSKLNLSEVSLAWLFNKTPDPLGWIDPNLLPAASDEPPVLVRPLLRTASLCNLRDVLPGGETALDQIFIAALTVPPLAPTEFERQLASTGWNLNDLITLLGSFGFISDLDAGLLSSAYAAFQDEVLLSRLVACFATLSRLGATAAQCLQWCLPEITPEASADIQRTARSRCTDSNWGEFAQAAQSLLRENRRQALVAYLIGKNQLRDSNDLYNYYLIDVEMRPAALTSRIKQACASVQLFVQRCLLNLEVGVPPGAIDTELWAWMRNYRVWEANRQVFLFPENWIEPELRDDKSEFFSQLESDLLQTNVTHQAGLDAFRSYVERLCAVSRLTVTSMYDEIAGADGANIVHVLARDGSTPYRYFYRQWRTLPGAAVGSWTTWEEVNAGIDNQHVQLFVFSGTVHVAWPTMTTEGDGGRVKITMNVAYRRPTGWSAPKRGRGQLWWAPPPNIDDSRGLVFRIRNSEDCVWVDCFGAKPPEGVFVTPSPITFVVNAPYPLPDGYLVGYQPTGGGGGTHNIPIVPIRANVAKSPSPAPTISPTGEFDLRILAKYTDNFARTFYWVATDLNFVLSVGKAPTVGTVGSHSGVYSKSHAGLPTLFSGLPQGPLSASLFVSPDIDDAKKYNPLEVESSFDLTGVGDFSLSGDMVVEVLRVDANPADPAALAVDADRPLKEFVLAGSFQLAETGDFSAYNSASGAQLSLVSDLAGAEPFYSAFRESAGLPAASGLLTSSTPPETLLTQTAGRFISTSPIIAADSAALDGVASFSVTTAYSDDGFDLIFSRGWIVRTLARSNSLRLPLPTPLPIPLPIPSVISYALVVAANPPSLLSKGLSRSIGNGDLSGAMALQQIVPVAGIPTPPANSSYPPVIGLEFGIEFDPCFPWASYNWETFFHVPLLVAGQLTQNQRFEEAQNWLHLVFDPTSGQSAGDVQPFWHFKPFRDAAMESSIEVELAGLAAGQTTLHDQIAAWQANPFQPHVIARMRPRAYQFFVLRKYLDNLIAWGDQLFLADTIESINEATQLYILASELLGRRPRPVATHQKPAVKTYARLRAGLDEFSNALVQVESFIPAGAGAGTNDTPAIPLSALYFGIPANAQLTAYWDTVEDRLFKIRHSLNLEGVARTLALYEPPIDPALLVRAAAAGVDIASALADLQSPMPYYRFHITLQKALELVNEVRAFGGSLLSALEKQDAENLALLRSTQEVALLKLVQTVKEKQRDEAQANVDSLRKTRELISQRYLQYQKLLGKPNVVVPQEGATISLEGTPVKASAAPTSSGGDTGGLGLSESESDHLSWMEAANVWTWLSGSTRTLSGVLHALPNTRVNAVAADVETGGSHWGHAAGAASDFLQTMASDASYRGSRAATVGGHQRRFDEWALQSNLAAKELEQVDKQIAAAEIRVAIANQELTNHQKQMDNAREVDDFMHDKFTNAQLYRWMCGQASGLYFRAFQIAYDMAKRAEKAFRFELGLADSDTDFIQFGYWDSLKKGLFAGEQLTLDLRRMDAAYLDRNKREMEITKHVSLRQLDAGQLSQLRQSGTCDIVLPEELFAMDFPCHYFRRLKSVSVSLPCVVGPYTSVSGTLTLMGSTLRTSADAGAAPVPVSQVGIQSIATSGAQNDSGLFDLNFHDERYLPFEGAGVASKWHFELPQEHAVFDYSAITDLVLHVRYTARDGGQSASTSVTSWLKSCANNLALLVSLRQDFPADWAKARQTPRGSLFSLDLTNLFPYFAGVGPSVASNGIRYAAVSSRGQAPASPQLTFGVSGLQLSFTADISGSSDVYIIVPYTVAAA